MKSAGTDGGLDWLEAVPRAQDTAFERIRLGFGKTGLEAMELKDQFGQMTVIKFADLERNVKDRARQLQVCAAQRRRRHQ